MFINSITFDISCRQLLGSRITGGALDDRCGIACILRTLELLKDSKDEAAVKGESELMLDSNTILIPLIVLLFAGLYRMAYLAAKDSKLTI